LQSLLQLAPKYGVDVFWTVLLLVQADTSISAGSML
jgi:hypothetical protein